MKLCNIKRKSWVLHSILTSLHPYTFSALFFLPRFLPLLATSLFLLSNIPLLLYKECYWLYKDRCPNPIACYKPEYSYNLYNSAAGRERKTISTKVVGWKAALYYVEGQPERKSGKAWGLRMLHVSWAVVWTYTSQWEVSCSTCWLKGVDSLSW